MRTLALAPVPGPGGIAIPLGAVADVREATATRRGDAGMNGRPAIVLTVKKQPKRDTVRLTRSSSAPWSAWRRSPGRAGRASCSSSRASSRPRSTTSRRRCATGRVVVFVLVLFLLNVRTTLITLTAIPLSFVVAVLVFEPSG